MNLGIQITRYRLASHGSMIELMGRAALAFCCGTLLYQSRLTGH